MIIPFRAWIFECIHMNYDQVRSKSYLHRITQQMMNFLCVLYSYILYKKWCPIFAGIMNSNGQICRIPNIVSVHDRSNEAYSMENEPLWRARWPMWIRIRMNRSTSYFPILMTAPAGVITRAVHVKGLGGDRHKRQRSAELFGPYFMDM